jgi:hypothetical protein
MNEKHRKMIVYIGAVICLSWTAYNYTPDMPEPLQPEQTPTNRPVISIQPVIEKDFVSLEDQHEKEWGRNPFRSWPGSKLKNNENKNNLAWIVGGILYSPATPIAYINGRAVKTGDTIDGATIISINKMTVTLEHKGQTFTLSVNKG